MAQDIWVKFAIVFCFISSGYAQIVEPPPSLRRTTVRAQHLGSVRTDIIPGALVSRNLRTNLVADIRNMPAPAGVTSQREAAEKVLQLHGHLMGINPDLSNLQFREATVGFRSSQGFAWDQTYEGFKLSGTGLVVVKVNSDLSIFFVTSNIEPITNPQPVSFSITSQQAISAAINILSAGNVPDPRPTTEQKVIVENGTPKGVWIVNFGNVLRIPWTIVVDGTTGEPLLGHRTDKF